MKSDCFSPYSTPPLFFSTSVGTSTSLVVTRIVVFASFAPGNGWGGSGGGNCCAAAGNETTKAISRQTDPTRKNRFRSAMPESSPKKRARRSPTFARLLFQAVCPREKTQQLPARVPDEAPDVSSSQRLRRFAGIGLHAPAQKLAAPWAKPVTTCCIPKKPKGREQGNPLALSIECTELASTELEGSRPRKSMTKACRINCPTQAARSRPPAPSAASRSAKAA